MTAKEFLLAGVLSCVLLAPIPTLAQNQLSPPTKQDNLVVALFDGEMDRYTVQSLKRYTIATVVGTFSGAVIARRIFRTPRAGWIGAGVGLLLPLWLYLREMQ